VIEARSYDVTAQQPSPGSAPSGKLDPLMPIKNANLVFTAHERSENVFESSMTPLRSNSLARCWYVMECPGHHLRSTTAGLHDAWPTRAAVQDTDTLSQ
jgi:hypothetical protein